MMPLAMVAQLTMPPNMFTKMAYTWSGKKEKSKDARCLIIRSAQTNVCTVKLRDMLHFVDWQTLKQRCQEALLMRPHFWVNDDIIFKKFVCIILEGY